MTFAAQPKGSDHVAGSPPDRPVQDRASDRAGADGGRDGFRARGRGRARRRPRLPAVRDAQRRAACASRSRNSARVPASRSTSIFSATRRRCPTTRARHAWRERLKPYYVELGVDPAAPIPNSNRAPFDAAFCEVVEDTQARGRQLSFRIAARRRFCKRVKAAGCSRHQLGHDGRGGALAASAASTR